jgi:hypothetical protein
MSKRTIAIGDIHCKTIWKDIVAKEKDADRIIFIGDYFDDFEMTPIEKQVENFEEICKLKKEGSKEVIILIGNHDYHYMSNGTWDRYSGFRPEGLESFNQSLNNNRKLLQIAFKDENDTIYSHAGITNTFLNNWYVNSKNGKVIVNTLNSMFVEHPDRFKFYEKDFSGYGNDENQGPLWVRPAALCVDKIDNCLVIGHSKLTHVGYDPTAKVYMIDCLDSSKEYLSAVGDKYDTETL